VNQEVIIILESMNKQVKLLTTLLV